MKKAKTELLADIFFSVLDPPVPTKLKRRAENSIEIGVDMFYVGISFNTSRGKDSIPIPVKDVRSERLRIILKLSNMGHGRRWIKKSGENSF